MKKEVRKTVYVYMPLSLYEKLAQKAERRGMSISSLINDCVSKCVSKVEENKQSEQ